MQDLWAWISKMGDRASDVVEIALYGGLGGWSG